MANSDKNILITPNIGSTNAEPKINFVGASANTGPSTITATIYPTNNGTLSFDGTEGSLFSISNNLSTGSIFSVNPISGIPIIDVNADRTITLNPFGGNTGIGTTNPLDKLDVNGTIRVRSGLRDYYGNVGAAGSILTVIGAGIGISWTTPFGAGLQGLQGLQGAQATQGTQGAQATQGTQGVQATQGTQGAQATQGTQGLQGRQGTQGSQATQGTQGVQATQGTQGSQATQGTQGVQATQGTQGAQASQGTQGAQASQGTQGVQSSQGTQGTQGVQATQGTQGAQASQGTQGTQATQGTQGAQATQGTQGAQATQGTQGSQATQGTQGVQGTQGSQATQGTQGTQGISGPVAGSANQVVYKDGDNNPTGSGNLTFDGSNLYVAGNVTIGGTSVLIASTTLTVRDKDIIVGLATTGGGIVISNDTTANHGGIAVASTEGSPLFDINAGFGTDDVPSTYKQIMWIKSGTFTGLNTDAWLFNYAVGVGTAQVPNGVRLAAGGMQVTDTTVSTQNLNVTGVGTFASSGLKIRNPANTFGYTIAGGAIAGDYTLTLPVFTAPTGIAITGPSATQTFTGTHSFIGTLSCTGTLNLLGGSNLTHSLVTNQTIGTLTIGGVTGTGGITLGQSTVSQTLNIATGISGVGTTKTINFGTGGGSGSLTQINIGPTAGVGTITINSGTNLGIGTILPSDPLDVNGNIRVRSGLRDYYGTVGAAGSILTVVGAGIGVSWTTPFAAGLQGLQGTQGVQATQGTQGAQATQGTQGVQATQGTQGVQATQGTQGAQATQGTQGVQATQGTQGVQATQGTQGVQATQGTQGAQATQGTQGSQATQGTQGVQATQGTQGVQATQGTQGTQGAQATQGTQGTQATQGTQGTQATQGTQGVQATQGTQGTQGSQATQGTQGVQGTQGSQATQGTQGTQGVQATQGTQGVQATQGTQGVQATQGTQGAQATQGTQGAQATQGTQGVQATQGTQGVQATQGTQGVQATQGTQGISGPVAGTANQVIYKDNTNTATGSGNLTFDGNNLYVAGNVTIGGTSVLIASTTLTVKDKDIIVGLATTGGGVVISNDTTANHGGIAVASTEGSPLFDINAGFGTDDVPSTYKQIMWLKSGTLTGLNTDAWLFNYAVGVGTAQVPNGVRLAAGGMQVTNTTVSTPQLSITGVSTFTNGPVLIGSAASTGTASQRLQVTDGAYVSGNLGIGRTNPSNKLEVLGNIVGYSPDTTSVATLAISNAGLLDITSFKSTGGTLRFVVADTGGVNQDRGRFNSTGNLLIATASDTGTASQRLQVTGGAYVSSNVGIAVTAPSFAVDVAGDARVTSTNKMRFGGTAGTTNFYIQYNSTANSLDFVAG
jgi:hypothetical protein